MESLEEWAFAGLSQKEMAEMLGMAYSTFRKLKGEIPALSALLKKSADFFLHKFPRAYRRINAKEPRKPEISMFFAAFLALFLFNIT